MTVTQRDWDIAQLESQLKIQRIFDEWMLGFLGARAPLLPQTNDDFDSRSEPFIQGGGAEEQMPTEENIIDSLGEGY